MNKVIIILYFLCFLGAGRRGFDNALYQHADFPIGCAVTAGQFLKYQKYRRNILCYFNSLTTGNAMKMSYLHPSVKKYNFKTTDRVADICKKKGLLLHGHTLIWHSDYQIPDWMKNYTGNYKIMLEEHIRTIVSHFRKKVSSWDVVNEAIIDNIQNPPSEWKKSLRKSIWYSNAGTDYIGQAFCRANEADSNVDLFYNDYNLINNSKKLDTVIAMMEDFLKHNIPIDGIGFQAHILVDKPAIDNIKKALQKAVKTGLLIRISELDIRVNTKGRLARLTPEADAALSERYREVVFAYRKIVPPQQRAGITVWGICDGSSWYNQGYSRYPEWPLLFTDDYIPKQAYYGFIKGLTAYIPEKKK